MRRDRGTLILRHKKEMILICNHHDCSGTQAPLPFADDTEKKQEIHELNSRNAN